MFEKKLNTIISESIRKTINEGNRIRNAETAKSLEPNIDKVMAHIKAAKNIMKKVGQYDDMRGHASSLYARIMRSLSEADMLMKEYMYTTWEGDENGVYTNADGEFKTPEYFRPR